MYNFNRGNNRFGGGRDSKRQGFGRRDFSDRPMFRTTCSKCGNDCEVPFRPTGERPVYCNKCFEHNRSTDSRRFEEKDPRGNTEGQFKKQFETLNWKLDKILKILTPPVVAPEIVKVMKPKKIPKSSEKEKISVE